MAKLISTWSYDPSTQTGAVIMRPNKSVASVGYNGFPQKMNDTPDLYASREEKYSRIIHCEMNALLFANERVVGYTLYTYPFISCDRCFVHMCQAGITRFVAPQATPDQLTRWGEAFNRVRNYADEMNVELIEIDYAN
jgi:dCMP deaminase